MAFDYSSLQAVAVRQIQDKGALVSLVRNIQNQYFVDQDSFGDFIPIFQVTENDTFLVTEDDRLLILEAGQSGQGGPKTTTQLSLYAVITDFNQNEIDGSLIRRSDKKALIAGTAIDKPDTFDELITASARYKIINVEEITPGQKSVLYKLQLRS